MSNQIPCILYAAKSTEDKRGSIPDQLADCRKKAEAEGQTVVGEYQDENASAFTGNRGGDLARAKEHAIRVGAEFWVQHSDRVARGDGITADHLAEVWFALRRHGVRMRSVQDDHNLEDAIRVVLIGERNNEDSKRKSLSVRDGMRRRATERGQHSGGKPPYGYRWEDGALVAVEHEAAVVRRIFDEYLSGRTQQAIARVLNREGIKTQGIGDKWVQPTIRSILQNAAYTGKVRHNGELYDGTHAPIIGAEQFAAAEAMRATAATSRNNGGGRQPNGRHLLTRGLLRCSCGAALMPRTSPRTSGVAEVYRCAGRHDDSEVCSQLPIRREVIDVPFLEEVNRRYLDIEESRARLAARRAADSVLSGNALAQAETESMRVAERIKRVVRAFQDGIIEAIDYKDQREGLLAEQAAADAQVARLQERTVEVEDDCSEEVLQTLSDLRAALLGGIENAPDLPALRTLLRQLFESVTYWPVERWSEALVIPGTSEGINVGQHVYAGQAVLIPALRRSSIAGYPGDPLDTQPTIQKAALDLPVVSESTRPQCHPAVFPATPTSSS